MDFLNNNQMWYVVLLSYVMEETDQEVATSFGVYFCVCMEQCQEDIHIWWVQAANNSKGNVSWYQYNWPVWHYKPLDLTALLEKETDLEEDSDNDTNTSEEEGFV
jgi:hypothetical protein